MNPFYRELLLGIFIVFVGAMLGFGLTRCDLPARAAQTVETAPFPRYLTQQGYMGTFTRADLVTVTAIGRKGALTPELDKLFTQRRAFIVKAGWQVSVQEVNSPFVRVRFVAPPHERFWVDPEALVLLWAEPPID